MHHLIIIIMSLALSAAASMAFVNYTPSDSLIRQRALQDAEAGMKRFEAGVIRYLDANRNIDGDVIYPGDGVDVGALVAPVYGYIPGPVRKKLVWSAVTGDHLGVPAVGICLAPIAPLSAAESAVLPMLQSRLPLWSTVIGNNCNASADVPGGTHLTYWIILTHLDGAGHLPSP